MGKESINVLVTTMDAELNFLISSSTTGKQLFKKVTSALGLRETPYFGLQFLDAKNSTTAWLKPDKKVVKQMGKKKSDGILLSFRVKFYPESVEEDVLQDVSLRLLYLQVKAMILSGEIHCSAETAVLLASYAMQAAYGDFNDEQHVPGFFGTAPLLPVAISSQYNLGADEWEQRIVTLWSDHCYLCQEFAMMEYLKIAEDLEMYGTNYFGIRNTKGTNLFLGVGALGLSVYESGNKLIPKVGFPWSEVHSISFREKKFVIKPIDKSAENFVSYSSHVSVNKQILSLCMGNHELYIRRRNPDPELLQLKKQCVELRMQRQAEQDKLEQVTRDLEQKEQQVQTLRGQLLSERLTNDSERVHLADQIASSETMVAEIGIQVDFEREEEELPQPEVDHQQKSPREEDASEFAEDISSVSVFSAHVDLLCVTGREADDGSSPFDELDIIASAEEKCQKVDNKLEELSKKLEAMKLDNAKVAEIDGKGDDKNVGCDKHKTFQDIRSGNTKRRIDQYENM